jgi:hypothetical protein
LFGVDFVYVSVYWNPSFGVDSVYVAAYSNLGFDRGMFSPI